MNSSKSALVSNGFVAVVLLIYSAWAWSRGDRGGAIFIGLGTLVALWWSWPSRGPHQSRHDATNSLTDRDAIVYWRPGCVSCTKLKISARLGASPVDGELKWVNIWRDPLAAEQVRELRDGNETVPTVVSPDGRLLNP